VEEPPVVVLVELGVVEQRYQAVLEVLNDGATVTDVARRYGVARQTVHGWLRRYADRGLAGLVDRSSRPLSCPHQMAPEIEARIVAMRREHPGWGARTIRTWLEREGIVALPGRTSIERCLVRHGLITPEARKRKRSDYRRWERARAMELWQMDIVGGVRLVDGSEAKIVSGIDDHSRFVISAFVVPRATARPVCDALAVAMRRHGVPEGHAGVAALAAEGQADDVGLGARRARRCSRLHAGRLQRVRETRWSGPPHRAACT
jgi:transposase-like protein